MLTCSFPRCLTYTKPTSLSLSLSHLHSIDQPPRSSLCAMMEVNTTVDSRKPHTGIHHHLHSQNRDHNHHFSSETLLIIIVAVASGLVLAFSIFLIIFMLRPKKCSPKNNSALDDNRNGSAALDDDPSCRFMSSATIMNLGSSPAVKGGCLSGGSVSMSRGGGGCNKVRGVQVFTYRELQEATEGFSEENVIGSGGSGSIYRGVLSDGTSAAIKLLRRQGRQAERAFRIEVNHFTTPFNVSCSYLPPLSPAHPPFPAHDNSVCSSQNYHLESVFLKRSIL